MSENFCTRCDKIVSDDCAKLIGNTSYDDLPPLTIFVDEAFDTDTEDDLHSSKLKDDIKMFSNLIHLARFYS